MIFIEIESTVVTASIQINKNSRNCEHSSDSKRQRADLSEITEVVCKFLLTMQTLLVCEEKEKNDYNYASNLYKKRLTHIYRLLLIFIYFFSIKL